MTIATENAHPSLEQLPENYLIALTNYSAIAVSGEEQKSYLQGQVTCDVNKSSASSLTTGAHCDAKGKVYSVFRLLQQPERQLLIQPNTTIAASMAALQKFGVFAKVEISAATDLSFVALIGSQAAELLKHYIAQLPDSMTPVVHGSELSVAYIAGAIDRYLIMASPAQIEQLILAAALPVYNADVWQLLEISEGFPILSDASIGEFVPQMLNVQAIHGISFTKGCYLGQETVARMQYLGKNKRALYALVGESEALDNDSQLERQLGDNWRSAGKVQASYHADNGYTYVQAVLANDIDHNSNLRVKDQLNTALRVKELPYSVTAQENS